MDNKHRCQSCGMPLDGNPQHLGTNGDGSSNPEFCTYCFQNGEFTMPELTVEGMIERSVAFMTGKLAYSRDQAVEMSRDVIPKLKRWTSRT